MADINLKTETPDTSLPTTGFLFGADSQAASSPSVFTVQSVATTLLGSTTLSGATITADAPVLNMSQTWNNAAVTFTGLKFNATNTASNAASRLIDLQIDTNSRFNISKDGYLNLKGTAAEINIGYLTETNLLLQQGGPIIAGNGALSWSSSNTAVSGGNRDLFLTRRGIANLRLGAADTTGTTAPTEQFLSAQSWASSTTNNQTGANFTIDGSQGTGTGAGGSIIFRVAPAGGTSNGVQNALITFLEATSARAFNLYGAFTDTSNYERLTLNFTASNDYTININKAGTGSNRSLTIETYGNSTATFESETLKLPNNGRFAFSSTSASRGSVDLILARDDANILALRNGTNAQEFRVYGTTDGTNSEYFSIKSNAGGQFEIGPRRTGTGASQNGALNATNTSGSSATTCLIWGSFGGGFVNTYVGFAGASAGTYDLGATTGGIGGAFRRLILSEYIETSEMTAPAAPAANKVRIYADTSGGKTRLMALFNGGGVAQVIAVQP